MATNKEMINRFKDMADCADAAYAKLHYVYDNDIFFDKKWNHGDSITIKHKTPSDIEIKDKSSDKSIIIKKDSNTTYARAIEARFCNEMIIKDDDGKDKQ